MLHWPAVKDLGAVIGTGFQRGGRAPLLWAVSNPELSWLWVPGALVATSFVDKACMLLCAGVGAAAVQQLRRAAVLRAAQAVMGRPHSRSCWMCRPWRRRPAPPA